MYADSSRKRNDTAAATSSHVPNLLMGIAFLTSSGSSIDAAISVSITPGATAFTVIPRFASSTASALTAPSTPAFAAD